MSVIEHAAATADFEPVEYRPSVPLGLFLASVLVVTAAILAWLGFILSPEDRSAMDGFTLLLFTAVPIRLFSWTFALIFLLLGLLKARRALRDEPTLVVSETGLTLPHGKRVDWSAVEQVVVSEDDLLVIEMAGSNQASNLETKRRWLRRMKPANQIHLSSIELGEDPTKAAEEINRRRPTLQ